MSEKNRTREEIYLKGYCIAVFVFSLISVILLLAAKFAWWNNNGLKYVHLSSSYRLSILAILPLILGFIGTGTLPILVLYVEQVTEDFGMRLIFWISLGLLGMTLISGIILLIAFSSIADGWGYGAGFIGSLLGAVIIVVLTLFYTNVKREL